MEIFTTLMKISCEPEDKGDQISARYCPICPKPHNEERTNLYTFGVNKSNGLFNCFRCNQSGNWAQFKELLSQRDGDLLANEDGGVPHQIEHLHLLQ